MKSTVLILSLLCITLSTAEINTPAIYGSCIEDEFKGEFFCVPSISCLRDSPVIRSKVRDSLSTFENRSIASLTCLTPTLKSCLDLWLGKHLIINNAPHTDLPCKIDSVTVEGCRKDRNSNACRVKRNVKAAINIEFTPAFEGEDLTLMAYALLPGIEKSFPDMDPDACKFMTCPVVNGTQQTYSFGLKLAPAYPLVSLRSFNEPPN
jgi:ML domain